MSSRLSRLAALATSLVLAGCSLIVNSGLENHPCGTNDACLPGYLCNSKGICVVESKAQCATACTGGTRCVRQQCVPICQNIACAPGFTCGGNGCTEIVAPGTVGTPCFDDSECGTDTSLFCMLPYTGGAPIKGVCTQKCSTTSADTCPNGSVCQKFNSTTMDGMDLCANPGLVTCKSDAECEPSDLACVVIAAKLTGGAISAAVCGSKIDGGAALGEACEPSTAPCTNGLCLVSTIGSTTTLRACSAPCKEGADCAGISGAICTDVTIVQPAEGSNPKPPIVRMPMCIVPPATVNTSCTPTNNHCGADAPHCEVSSANGTDTICAPDCTDTLTDRCPNAALVCNVASGICH